MNLRRLSPQQIHYIRSRIRSKQQRRISTIAQRKTMYAFEMCSDRFLKRCDAVCRRLMGELNRRIINNG